MNTQLMELYTTLTSDPYAREAFLADSKDQIPSLDAHEISRALGNPTWARCAIVGDPGDDPLAPVIS